MQSSYLPIWTDGVVVVFAVEVNFVLELTTSERTRISIQLSYSSSSFVKNKQFTIYVPFIRTNLPELNYPDSILSATLKEKVIILKHLGTTFRNDMEIIASNLRLLPTLESTKKSLFSLLIDNIEVNHFICTLCLQKKNLKKRFRKKKTPANKVKKN